MAKRTSKRSSGGDGAKRDVFQEITDRFIAAIESGQASGDQWQMPWRRLGMSIPRNVATGKSYKGINVLVLGIVAEDAGQPALWGTFRQWAKLGCHVKRGERATAGVKWTEIKLRQNAAEQASADVSADEDGERRTRWIPLAFSVFHVGQVEPNVVRYSGRIRTVRHASSRDLVLAKYAPAPLAPLERDEKAEKVLTAVGADVRHGGDSAYYNRRTDHVQLPEPGQFHDAIAYFGTWAHELGHWTGNAERTNRHALPNHLMPGTPDEELVAELSATFTCQHLGIEPTPRDDHAHYVASWLTALKNDNRALYRAAKLAEQATAYLMEAAGVDMSDPEPMIEHEDAA